MQIKVLRTREEMDLGLQHMTRIPNDTIYVFVGPFLGGQFHSRNVPEPFDLVFLSAGLQVMSQNRLTPPNDVVRIPPDVMYALEAKPGVLERFIK
jgi:uncharacterized membrane protein (UPF0127 family)